jgi:hypothetical protein
LNTVVKETGKPMPPSSTPGPFTLSDENNLKNSFLTSGFKDSTIEKMNVTLDFESAGEFTNFVLETDGSVQTILTNQKHEKERR